MALTHDPIAREQLYEMRATLGPLYINAVWALRGFEQEARNVEAIARWRESYPAWDRLFGRAEIRVRPASADVIAMLNGRAEDSKAA